MMYALTTLEKLSILLLEKLYLKQSYLKSNGPHSAIFLAVFFIFAALKSASSGLQSESLEISGEFERISVILSPQR